jgi:type III pantothenate kinase
MLLAIDVGNTRIKAGLWDGEDWVHLENAPSSEAGLKALAQTGILKSGEIAATCSSVVPDLNEPLRKLVSVPIVWLSRYLGFGDLETDVIYEPVTSLGADRLANALGAIARSKLGAAIAVDLGTATKIDVISDKDSRTYHGGAILPGLGMGVEALSKGTALLPAIDLSLTPRIIGTTTEDCIRSGVLYGHAAAIDGIVDRMKQELNREVDVFITGGYAPLVIPLCRTNMSYVPRLTLNGLVAVDWIRGDSVEDIPIPDRDDR